MLSWKGLAAQVTVYEWTDPFCHDCRRHMKQTAAVLMTPHGAKELCAPCYFERQQREQKIDDLRATGLINDHEALELKMGVRLPKPEDIH